MFIETLVGLRGMRTEEQRTKLAELKQTSQRRALGKEPMGHGGIGHGARPSALSVDHFLGSNRATTEQIAAWVAAKNKTRRRSWGPNVNR